MGGACWPWRRRLVAIWVGAAVGFGALLALAESARSPLDDPDPARQRPGVVDLGALPTPAPRLTAEVPGRGQATVIFFERPDRLAPLCGAIARHRLARGALAAVVVSEPAVSCPVAPVVVDPTASLARRFGLPVPRDGGPPVGYVVVDARGLTRYRTLDPAVSRNLPEVDTILAST